MKFKIYTPLERTTITQGFGKDTSPAMLPLYKSMGLAGHNGLDYFAPDGTSVYASHDGRVTFAGYDGSGGLGVVIRTNEEFEDVEGKPTYFKSIYWHLKKDSLLVTGSQQVVRGQKIGEADNTGMSTGSHLHYGIKPIAKGENDWTWWNTEQNNGMFGAVDPTLYLVKFQHEMKYGEQSQNVRDLQEFLKTLGLFAVQGTGFYGAITAKAVLDFQIANCQLSFYERYVLKGAKVGPKTLSSLNSVV